MNSLLCENSWYFLKSLQYSSPSGHEVGIYKWGLSLDNKFTLIMCKYVPKILMFKTFFIHDFKAYQVSKCMNEYLVNYQWKTAQIWFSLLNWRWTCFEAKAHCVL